MQLHLSDVPGRLTSTRPPAETRCFTNGRVEDKLREVVDTMADPELAWLFGNCYPNTLDTTVFYGVDGQGKPDTYVITGDIAAMWLRDSAAQVRPYLPLIGEDAGLRSMIEGVVRRQARAILLDPYANAFYRDPVLGRWKDDCTEMRPGVHERKWELDSVAYFLRLSHDYWTHAGDCAPFDQTWRSAVEAVLALLRVEQSGDDESPGSPYTFRRGTGRPPNARRRRCGLVRCAFRPSDDAVVYPFLVPANALMAGALRAIAPLLVELGMTEEASEARAVEMDIRSALAAAATVHHPRYGNILAYEVDGLGGRHLMDDANAPSLLSLPYLGFCAKDDPIYMATRAFCLRSDNPHYVAGTAACGIGSPHTGPGTIWPMALIMQGLTAVTDEEIVGCLHRLKSTHAGTGMMHESFHANDPERYTRPWFAWANSLFGELILLLHRERPHLLQQIF